MPALREVIPIMESTIGALVDGTQGVADWVEMMKLSANNSRDRDSELWTFLVLTDVDETAEILVTALGGGDQGSVTRQIVDILVYGLLIRANTGETGDGVVVHVAAEDADFTFTSILLDWDLDGSNTGRIAFDCPASDGTSISYQGYAIPGGLRITTDAGVDGADEIYCGADDNEGNNPTAGGVDVYIFGKVIAHDA